MGNCSDPAVSRKAFLDLSNYSSFNVLKELGQAYADVRESDEL